VIVGWIIVAIAVIATAPALPTTTNEASFLPSSYESIKAQNLQDQAFPQAGRVDAAAAIVVFARTDGGRLTPADKAKVASVASTLNDKHITNVLGITAGPVSPNGLVQTVSVAMNNNLVNGSGTQAGDAVKVLRADIKPLMSGSDLYEGVTGSAAQQLDSEQSGNKAEAIVLFATLLLTARLTSTRTARPPSSSSSCCSASGRTTSCS
jgi:putative drug exporter of the RND superfamily